MDNSELWKLWNSEHKRDITLAVFGLEMAPEVREKLNPLAESWEIEYKKLKYSGSYHDY